MRRYKSFALKASRILTSRESSCQLYFRQPRCSRRYARDALRQEDVTGVEAPKKRFAVLLGVMLCVHECLEGVCQRIVQLRGDIAVEILQSRDKSSLPWRQDRFVLSEIPSYRDPIDNEIFKNLWVADVSGDDRPSSAFIS